jgi:Chaperone for protein-folding within the ER, fungal
MQWQHGTYSLQPNGSLVLTPIQSDGRQLMSDPCAGHTATYTHYNQSELFQVRAVS